MYVQTYIQNRFYTCDFCENQFLHDHEPYASILYQDNGETAYICEKCMISKCDNIYEMLKQNIIGFQYGSSNFYTIFENNKNVKRSLNNSLKNICP